MLVRERACTISACVKRIPLIPAAVPILVKQPPAGPNWLHEIKWDGWRCQVIKDADGIRIDTRKGNDWTDQLHGICEAARALKLVVSQSMANSSVSTTATTSTRFPPPSGAAR